MYIFRVGYLPDNIECYLINLSAVASRYYFCCGPLIKLLGSIYRCLSPRCIYLYK